MRILGRGFLIASAAATLLISSQTFSADALMGHSKPIKCYGANSCKGKGQCGTKANACSGQNACKGKGWIFLLPEQCKAKGGRL